MPNPKTLTDLTPAAIVIQRDQVEEAAALGYRFICSPSGWGDTSPYVLACLIELSPAGTGGARELLAALPDTIPPRDPRDCAILYMM